ncbi:YacL family protein [Thalassotalea crassostreae]|uniref:UPF0231 family protein n=1 Tax=Thalassotalea crassostreae TaxID=1763536 RepID=UPI0008381BE6|nr:YacL family protein [Thalassotalea crassostreae]
MEYTFKTNFITKQPQANFSFGHELFGPWLEQEIGKDLVKLQSLLDLIDSLAFSTNEHTLVGKEYSLTINNQEVEVFANSNNIDEAVPQNIAEDVNDFEQTCFALCGLEDFVEMLESWQNFI